MLPDPPGDARHLLEIENLTVEFPFAAPAVTTVRSLSIRSRFMP
jgi:hypothetical protein